MTLLERAKDSNVGRKPTQQVVNFEELCLALAYIKREVNEKQMKVALCKGGKFCANTWANGRLANAIRSGQARVTTAA